MTSDVLTGLKFCKTSKNENVKKNQKFEHRCTLMQLADVNAMTVLFKETEERLSAVSIFL